MKYVAEYLVHPDSNFSLTAKIYTQRIFATQKYEAKTTRIEENYNFIVKKLKRICEVVTRQGLEVLKSLELNQLFIDTAFGHKADVIAAF
jgi:Cdc6-like AAA superfamily ATPase